MSSTVHFSIFILSIIMMFRAGQLHYQMLQYGVVYFYKGRIRFDRAIPLHCALVTIISVVTVVIITRTEPLYYLDGPQMNPQAGLVSSVFLSVAAFMAVVGIVVYFMNCSHMDDALSWQESFSMRDRTPGQESKGMIRVVRKE